MEHGDLETGSRETIYVVIEGVLVEASVNTQHRLLRSSITTQHLTWLEVPLKRLIVTKGRYPHYEISLITFLDQDVADQAAWYLGLIGQPFDEVSAWDLNTFCSILPYQQYVRAVYDSDPERLDRYGQVGVSVVKGEDW